MNYTLNNNAETSDDVDEFGLDMDETPEDGDSSDDEYQEDGDSSDDDSED